MISRAIIYISNLILSGCEYSLVTKYEPNHSCDLEGAADHTHFASGRLDEENRLY